MTTRPGHQRPIAVIQTESGSIYRFYRDDNGRWWVRARNRPSLTSTALPPDVGFEILPPAPWPPRLFAPLVFVSAVEDRSSPSRLPGGGKVTSAVVLVDYENGEAAGVGG